MRLLLLISSLLLFHAADIAGKWRVTAKSPGGREILSTVTFKNSEGVYSGTLVTDEGDSVPLAEIKLDGSELTFKVLTDDGAFAVTMAVEEDAMKGTYKTPSGESSTVAAARVKQ